MIIPDLTPKKNSYYHPLSWCTTLIISAISIGSWYKIWSTVSDKTLMIVARQVQVLPIDKSRLGNSESMGRWKTNQICKVFFSFEREWWNRGCWNYIYIYIFNSLRFQIFGNPTCSSVSLGSSRGYSCRRLQTSHGRNAMGRKNVRRRSRVLVKFVQCKAEIVPHQQSAGWLDASWAVGWNCTCWANQIPEIWINVNRIWETLDDLWQATYLVCESS